MIFFYYWILSTFPAQDDSDDSDVYVVSDQID